MAQEIFSYLEDDRLEDMDVAGLSGDDVERLIQEYSRRDIDSDGDDFFQRLVHARLEELEARYAELQCLFYDQPPDRKEVVEEYIDRIREYFKTRQDNEEEVSEDEEEPWPWPMTQAPAGVGGAKDLSFANKYSGLKLCGYTVGKTNGLSLDERKRFLDDFYQRNLPNVVEEIHGNAYGAPNSSLRLKKMAHNIAWNCRNKKKISEYRYRVAIADWETDLRYLKNQYYDGRFRWPYT